MLLDVQGQLDKFLQWILSIRPILCSIAGIISITRIAFLWMSAHDKRMAIEETLYWVVAIVVFFVLSIIRYWISLSLWWYTSTPCLFIIGLLIFKVLRKESMNAASLYSQQRIVLINLAGKFHQMTTIAKHLGVVK